jgi:hydroxymethylbilane synthase
MTAPFPDRPFRIGTRASPLALAQAHSVRDHLCATHGWAGEAVEIISSVATGDRILDRPLAEVGGKALWTKELDQALLAGDIDCAVHSMKDVETHRPPVLLIAAMLPRADVRDRLIGADSLDSLAHGARVGTSSPRRTAQLKRLRPDLEISLLRGNVGTRLAKIERGEADATLLAAAGLDRLGMTDIGAPLSLDMLLPAPSQGAIGIEIHERHRDLGFVDAINDDATFLCVAAERRWLKAVGGDCHSAVAAHATLDNALLSFTAEMMLPDGSETVRRTAIFDPAAMDAAISALAAEMLAAASPALRAMFTP